jgi:hypothetical protein
LTALGFRHRRRHDWRRTFISLAIGEDGARKDVLERCPTRPSAVAKRRRSTST